MVSRTEMPDEVKKVMRDTIEDFISENRHIVIIGVTQDNQAHMVGTMEPEVINAVLAQALISRQAVERVMKRNDDGTFRIVEGDGEDE